MKPVSVPPPAGPGSGRRSTKPWPYEDIVNLPHHVSDHHPPMPIEKRAAQFAPFAALTGYEDAIARTAAQAEEDVENEYK